MRRNVNGWVLGLGVVLLPGMAAAQQEPEPPPGVTPASAYVGLSSSCAVFSGQWWNAGDVRGTPVRGVCGVPQGAVAVQLEVRSESLGGQSPQVKVWAADAPEPTQGVLEEDFGPAGQARQALTLVSLCGDGACAEGDLLLRSSAQALLELRVAGYFQPWAAVSGESAEDLTGVSGGSTLTAASDELLLEPLFTEGPSNNFFGSGAGANTTGFQNSFFGANAGQQNTSGSANSFFGQSAGERNTTGASNAFFGQGAGFANTTGAFNAFFGQSAGLRNTTGFANAFFGRSAGQNNTTGFDNAFFGVNAGDQNTSGSDNALFGRQAGLNNTTGSQNAFFGRSAGRANTTGADNTFVGTSAGINNTTGGANAFFGASAGVRNTTGSSNTFVGRSAGFENTTGFNNAFVGAEAGSSNTMGINNAFFGTSAGTSNTTGDNNTFIGVLSNGVANITNATALGHRAQVRQSNSLVLGSIAGENRATESVNVGIGVSAPERQLHLSGPNAQIRIDRPVDATSFQLVRTNAQGDVLKSFVFGVLASEPDNGSFFIRDNAQQTGGATNRVRMQIDNAGNTTFQGTVSAVAFNSTSSARFKTDVTTLSDADASLQRLRGVRFHWKESGTPSLGLIAEEVAEVFPELVQFDAATGAAEAVNYAALVAVLIEGYKEQQERLGVQEQQLAAQQKQLAELATLRAQVAAIERLLVDSQPVLAQR